MPKWEGKVIVINNELKSIEEAASGVIASAFGFQGQKCSACSRVIVSEKIYDNFLDLLVDKASSLKIGETKDNPNMGPVVNARARESILNYVRKAVEEGGQVVFGGKNQKGTGIISSRRSSPT